MEDAGYVYVIFYCLMGVMGVMGVMGSLGMMGAAPNGGSNLLAALINTSSLFPLHSSLFILPSSLIPLHSSLFILPLNYITFISSTSNISAEYGGIDCPAPDSP